MGHKNSKQRLQTIKENVEYISQKVRNEQLSASDKERYRQILLDYSQELRLILSKNIQPKRIVKVENSIDVALQNLNGLQPNYLYHRKITNVREKKKLQLLREIEDIKKQILSITYNLKNWTLQQRLEILKEKKRRLSEIEVWDSKLQIKKIETFQALSEAEAVLAELQTEEKLQRIEQKHYQSRVNLTKYTGLINSDSYQEHKGHLLQLKDDISRIEAGENSKFETKKLYILYNLDNNLLCLEQKVLQNEESVKNQSVTDAYNSPSPSAMNQILISEFVASYKEFERLFGVSGGVKEMQDICSQLKDVKIKIDQKIKTLEREITLQTQKFCLDLREENVNNFINGSENPSNEENPYVCLLPKKRKSDDTTTNSFELKTRLEEILKEVEDIRHQIFNMQSISKQSHIYMDLTKKLEGCKIEAINASHGGEDCRKLRENILQFISDVTTLLENNPTGQGDATGELLIDMMSVSSMVNELGGTISTTMTLHDSLTLEGNLFDHLNYLNQLQIPSTRTNLCKFRDYVVIQIESHLSNLRKQRREKYFSESENREEDTLLTD